MLRYLKGTQSFQLAYQRDVYAEPLVGIVDADWGSDFNDRKSVFEFLLKVFDAVICWSSKK